ncbi:MAG: MFS transporter [Opitutales bacterium]
MKESSPSPVTRAMQMTLLAGFLGWMMDGFEQGIFPMLASPALNSMVPPEVVGQGAQAAKGWVGGWMGWITSAYLLGAALGGAAFGWLGDRIGRVRAMSLSILFYSLFSGLCYFAQEPWHFLVFRFFASLGMGGEWALGVALVMEVWPERHRSKMAGAIGMAANAGYVLVGVVGLLYPATAETWRVHFLIGASPAILTLLVRLFVPESERWKQAVRSESAVRGPSKIAEVFGPERRGAAFAAILLTSIVNIGTWGAVQWVSLWVESLAGEGNPRAKAYAMAILSVGACIGTFLAPVLLAPLPRRRGYQLLSCFALAACFWLYRTPAEWGALMMLKILLLGGTTAAFFGFFPLYLPELFPTRIRATGQGICFNAGRIVAIPFVVFSGFLVERLGGYQSAAAAVTLVYLLGILAPLLARETGGRPLED